MDKESILQASEKTFFAKKIYEVNLDHIANKIGIKKPTLYYYFSNKKELFLETLKYSKKKYINALKKTLNKNDIKSLLEWYLIYPNKQKNLFAVALQKEYCNDKPSKQIIHQGRKSIFDLIKKHFQKKTTLNETKIYIIMNLLEKLGGNNCIDDYCLKYDIDELTREIKDMIETNN